MERSIRYLMKALSVKRLKYGGLATRRKFQIRKSDSLFRKLKLCYVKFDVEMLMLFFAKFYNAIVKEYNCSDKRHMVSW